jgi:catechol 2,3-dioxygenase-like lactoylglutathione lyase family enzyme
VIRDPDDHFVQLLAAGNTATPLAPRIRLTVQNLDRALALYRDGLGLRGATTPPASDEWLTTALGLTRSATVSARALEVPGSGLTIEFIQFGGTGRPGARIQDPGSTCLQLQVRDLDAAMKVVVAAGGQVISTGGVLVELPAGRGAPIRATNVRDPDNLFLLVLIQAAAPCRSGRGGSHNATSVDSTPLMSPECRLSSHAEPRRTRREDPLCDFGAVA